MIKSKAKLIIMINCILVCFLLLVSGTLAAYTSISNAKRTVSTVGSKQFFSSNVLLPYGEETDILVKAVPLTSGKETNSFYISICNYRQGDKNRWATTDIKYKLSVSLLDTEGNTVTDSKILGQYKCDSNGFDALKDGITGTLASNTKEPSECLYLITVPTELMGDYRIKITAVSDVNGYQPIGRYITAAEEAVSAKWKLSFLQDELEQNSYDLGCINTKLTGSEHASLTLTWDTEHVEIDPWFLIDMNLSTIVNEGKHTGSITFNAGGDELPHQYNIIFYRTVAVRSDDAQREEWRDIKKYITLSSTSIPNTADAE